MEMIIILLLILCNGLFVMSEMAIVSSRKTRLQQWANEGNSRAKIALELAQSPNRFLSMIQVGITLIGILSGAFGGTTIAHSLEIYLAGFPSLKAYSHPIALGLVVLGITYLSIIIGELVPKQLALGHPERIASALAASLKKAAILTHPALQILTLSSEGILRIFGHKPSQEPPVSEEEIKILIDQGTQEGVFAQAEKDIVKSVFRLADREVGVLMTPRLDIIWLDLNDPYEENRKKIIENPFNRFPVAKGGLDEVIGVVRAKDLLVQALSGQSLVPEEKMSPPLYIPENAPAMLLLDLFKKQRPHLALVVDEYGGIQGLVTLNDILESIVGDIAPQDQGAETTVTLREDGSWLVDGMIPIDEFKDLFGLSELPEEESGHFQTLGGFIMMQMGRIPAPADYFKWGDLRFEVMDMDGKRVDKVLISQEKDQD
jgi:putative hemolysin